jgi:membrane protein DedA with SNARE-associated domain
MIAHIFSVLTHFITNVISSGGYAGIVLLMAIESAAIPLPSEIIMPFAGYLVTTGRFTLLGITLAGAIGSAIGSAVIYAIGYFGGRPLIEKYGKYVLIDHRDIAKAEVFFEKYDRRVSFFARIIPIGRTFISLPAGILRTNFKLFLLYSFIGSLIWCWFLGWLGIKLGVNWETLRNYFHGLDYVIAALILLAIAWYVRRHIKNLKRVD